MDSFCLLHRCRLQTLAQACVLQQQFAKTGVPERFRSLSAALTVRRDAVRGARAIAATRTIVVMQPVPRSWGGCKSS